MFAHEDTQPKPHFILYFSIPQRPTNLTSNQSEVTRELWGRTPNISTHTTSTRRDIRPAEALSNLPTILRNSVHSLTARNRSGHRLDRGEAQQPSVLRPMIARTHHAGPFPVLPIAQTRDTPHHPARDARSVPSLFARAALFFPRRARATARDRRRTLCDLRHPVERRSWRGIPLRRSTFIACRVAAASKRA